MNARYGQPDRRQLGFILWCAAFLVCFGPSPARAQSGTTCPSEWQFDDDAVGRCLGNCGIDCSNDVNWWCSNGAGWRIDATFGPEEYLYGTGTIEYCSGDYRCTSECALVRVPGQFSYWGTYAPGCHTHDEWCREGNPWCWVPPPGFLATICLGQEDRAWTYTGYAHAVVIMDTQCVYDWPRCPEIATRSPTRRSMQGGDLEKGLQQSGGARK